MKKRQMENSETSKISEISEILFRVFLFPSFRFPSTAKIKNSDLKISEKIFRGFRVFELAGYTCMFMFGILNIHSQNLWNFLFYFQIDIWTYWSAGFYVAR